ncbi:MAG: porin family protein [Prevotella sp.]|nr:porin family protein [Prevotella sp.]
MKKTILHLLPVLSLLAAVPAQAQFKLGVTAGLNISKLSVNDDECKKYVDKIRPGFVVGPTAIYTIPKTGLGIDASALFDLRGAKSKTISDSKAVTCTSLQVPVNLRFGSQIGDMVYGFVFTGPQWGFGLGSKESVLAEGIGKTTGHEMERRWVNRSTAFSWNFGLGGVVLEKLQVRVSYNLALRKTAEIQQVDLVDGSKTRVLADGKAHACQIALSYLF